MFSQFAAYPGDPIFSLQQIYAQDDRHGKVNLSIGVYHDEMGHIPVLESIRYASQRLKTSEAPWIYQPMAGAPEYRQAVQALLFGEDHPKITAGHVATIQTVGGSGALKIGSELLRRYFPEADVWISDPSWDNHAAIFEGSGFRVHRYPYLDMPTRGVDFAGMVGCLNTLPPRSIVLLHPCCHNPTGADLTKEQWGEITNIAGSRRLIPFLDMAYQGFGENIDEDCYAIRAMADAGLSFFISSSFSKNFSLYGERCGGLSIICQSVDEAARALGQMEITVRRNYSSPPAHGGQLVTTILLDQELRKLWLSEVNAMRRRIKAMRNELHAALQRKRPAADFDYIVQQRGMFAYTGLSPAQVRELRTRFGIYLVESGRLCVAGLNAENVHRVATAMAEVIRQ